LLKISLYVIKNTLSCINTWLTIIMLIIIYLLLLHFIYPLFLSGLPKAKCWIFRCNIIWSYYFIYFFGFTLFTFYFNNIILVNLFVVPSTSCWNIPYDTIIWFIFLFDDMLTQKYFTETFVCWITTWKYWNIF